MSRRMLVIALACFSVLAGAADEAPTVRKFRRLYLT